MSPMEALRARAEMRVEMAVSELSAHLRSCGLPPQEFTPEAKEKMVEHQLELYKGIQEFN